MNRKYFLSFILTAGLLLSGAACSEKINTETPDSGDTVTEINGVPVAEGNNVAGLVYNPADGKGIPDIPVTDGYKYVRTDRNGVYQMKANRYSTILYLSVPSEYEIPLDTDLHPSFYKAVSLSNKGAVRVDFSLKKRKIVSDEFTLIGLADPQCNEDEEVARFSKETVPDILASAGSRGQTEVYAITLGDITHDNIRYWPAMYKAMSNVKLPDGRCIPFFQTIGNHDFNASGSTVAEAEKMFLDTFGPHDYSVNIGRAHIVAMNDVQLKSSNGKTWAYTAGFTKSQYNWLKDDLDQVENKEDRLLIFCVHIPFRNGATTGSGGVVNRDQYYAEVLSLFKDFQEVHILSGHRHYAQNWIHDSYKSANGNPYYEHVQAAACGAFWECNSNLDGAPNGYTIYSIKGNGIYDWTFKGTGLEEKDSQIRVYDGNQIYSGQNGIEYTWYNGGSSGGYNALGNPELKGCFVASVWDEDKYNWTVELYKDGVKAGDLKRISKENSLTNPWAASYFFNELNFKSGDFVSPTSHYWYIPAPGGSPSLETGWEIRATRTTPDSGVKKTYTCSRLTKDYAEF